MLLEHNGAKLTLRQWADNLGIPAVVLQSRLYQGWPIERVLTTPFVKPVVEEEEPPPPRPRQRSTSSKHPRSDAQRIEHNGECLTVNEWAMRIGITREAIRHRLKIGMPIERAVTQPSQRNAGKRVEHNGKTMNLKEWSRHLGISYGSLLWRMKHWRVARALKEARNNTGMAAKQDDTGGGSELSNIAPGPAAPIRARSDEIQVSMNKESSSCP